MSASSEPSPLDAGPYHELEVIRIVEETHDTRSVVLGIPESMREIYAYEAGQFLTFRVTVDTFRCRIVLPAVRLAWPSRP